jgi:hypothetical protein
VDLLRDVKDLTMEKLDLRCVQAYRRTPEHLAGGKIGAKLAAEVVPVEDRE